MTNMMNITFTAGEADEAISIMQEAAKWLQVVLENDAISAVLAKGLLLADLLQRYNKVKVCLDIGRLHLQEMLDPSFDAMEFAELTAPFTYLIHLWDTSFVQNLSGGHYPVLPGLRPSAGWADIKAFIDIIKGYNTNVKVLFEHRSDLVSDAELSECYRWVGQMLWG